MSARDKARRLLVTLVIAGCSDGTAATTDGGSDAGADVGSPDDPFEVQRQACTFQAGALASETIGGVPAAIPIDHLIVLMQENRSFDHYLGHHPTLGSIPANYTNPDLANAPHAPVHLATTCVSPDLPHDWYSMHRMWNDGGMDGFYREAETANAATASNALGLYEPADLPFYSWLYGAFASSDRFFCSVLGPTAPNRKYLMTATSNGTRGSGDILVGTQRSIFQALDDAGTTYRMYNPETYDVPAAPPSAVRDLPAFFADLAAGTLSKISFVNALFANSEHPPLDRSAGEKFVRDVVVALATSPSWATSALVVTYDESGGFFDHVPPPSACVPDALPLNAAFDRLGFRVPFVIVSAYARRSFVSHRDHSHTSITRLIELLAGLPALTNRDANSDALLDLFDFASAPSPPPDVSSIPNAGMSTCAIPDAGASDAPSD